MLRDAFVDAPVLKREQQHREAALTAVRFLQGRSRMPIAEELKYPQCEDMSHPRKSQCEDNLYATDF